MINYIATLSQRHPFPKPSSLAFPFQWMESKFYQLPSGKTRAPAWLVLTFSHVLTIPHAVLILSSLFHMGSLLCHWWDIVEIPVYIFPNNPEKDLLLSLANIFNDALKQFHKVSFSIVENIFYWLFLSVVQPYKKSVMLRIMFLEEI